MGNFYRILLIIVFLNQGVILSMQCYITNKQIITTLQIQNPDTNYLFAGPGTYIPRKEVEVLGAVKATIIKPIIFYRAWNLYPTERG